MSLDPITALLNVGESVIERIWPDANERGKRMMELEKLAHEGELVKLEAEVKLLAAQLEVNANEAKHKSIFVAGWRPFCGWVGGLSLAYAAIVEPLMRFVAKMSGYQGVFPVLDVSVTMAVLMGMLGMGAQRSFDKKNGVETNSIK